MNFLSWRVEKTFLKVARKKHEKKKLINQPVSKTKRKQNKTLGTAEKETGRDRKQAERKYLQLISQTSLLLQMYL